MDPAPGLLCPTPWGQKANTSEINPSLIRWTWTHGSHSSHLVTRLRSCTLLEIRWDKSNVQGPPGCALSDNFPRPPRCWALTGPVCWPPGSLLCPQMCVMPPCTRQPQVTGLMNRQPNGGAQNRAERKKSEREIRNTTHLQSLKLYGAQTRKYMCKKYEIC